MAIWRANGSTTTGELDLSAPALILPGLLLLLPLSLTAQRSRDSAHEAERREMFRLARERPLYDQGYSCTADSSRLYREAGSREPAAVAAVFARRISDSTRQRLVLEGCRDALSGAPNRYRGAEAAQRERMEALGREGPRKPRPSRWQPFGEFSWVFYADVSLGLLVGAGAARFRYRNQSSGARWFAISLLGLLGLCLGGAIFVPILFLSQLVLFLNPPKPPAVFAMSLFAILWVAGSILGASAIRKRRARMRV